MENTPKEEVYGVELKLDLAVIKALTSAHETVADIIPRLPLLAFKARRELIDELRAITETIESLSTRRFECSGNVCAIIADAFNKEAAAFEEDDHDKPPFPSDQP